MDRFPELKGRPLWLSGESYGGHYVPGLAAAIVKVRQKSGATSAVYPLPAFSQLLSRIVLRVPVELCANFPVNAVVSAFCVPLLRLMTPLPPSSILMTQPGERGGRGAPPQLERLPCWYAPPLKAPARRPFLICFQFTACDRHQHEPDVSGAVDADAAIRQPLDRCRHRQPRSIGLLVLACHSVYEDRRGKPPLLCSERPC